VHGILAAILHFDGITYFNFLARKLRAGGYCEQIQAVYFCCCNFLPCRWLIIDIYV